MAGMQDPFGYRPDLAREGADAAFIGLGRLGTHIRYGESPEEHNAFAASGEALGKKPEEIEDPWEARRAASAYRGGERWGAMPSMALHQLRQDFNIGGGDAGEEGKMDKAAIEGLTRGIAAKNLEGKAGHVSPETDPRANFLQDVLNHRQNGSSGFLDDLGMLKSFLGAVRGR